MKTSLKLRIAVTIVAILVGTALGAAAGLLLGRNLILSRADSALVALAQNTIQEADRSSREARTVLAAINASHEPLCSDPAIAMLRKLVFQSEYLKGAGEIEGGKIVCSANLGRLREPLPLQKPSFSQADGITVYRNFAPLPMGNLTVVALQMGHGYVIISPYLETHRTVPPAHYVSTAVNNPDWRTARLLESFPQVTRAVLTTQGHGRAGNELYATGCSPHYFVCMTDYEAIPDLLRERRQELEGHAALGALIGAGLGLLVSFFYRHNRSMAQQLRRAIRREQLGLVYQPIVRLGDRQMVGVEALARWTDEEGFAVPPHVFIPLAEERGFVGELTRLVLHKALGELAGVLREHPGFRLNLNVAAADLGDPDFVPMFERALKELGVSAGSVGIEITESSTAQNELILATLERIHALGVSISIDDFGTGYSSLSYLHELPVDCLKVDKSFTHAIGTESVTAAILPQILAMARTLRLEVVIEGIETAEQMAYFQGREEPPLMQGWLFGYPVPVEELLKTLESNRGPFGALVQAG